MIIDIQKTWETVYFSAYHKKKNKQLVELSFNFTTLAFNIQESNEEGIRFDNVSLEEAQLKLKAVQSALDYVQEKLKNT